MLKQRILSALVLLPLPILALWYESPWFELLCAAVLTVIYPDDIAALGSLTSGVVGMMVNLVLYVVVSLATRNRMSKREIDHVDELFEVASAKRSALPAAESQQVESEVTATEDAVVQ